MIDQLGSFSGRLGRVGYLVWSVAATIFLSATTWLGSAMVHQGHAQGAIAFIALGWVLALLGLVLAFWVGAAAAVKRLHDLNLPGWHAVWILGLYFAWPILVIMSLDTVAAMDKILVLLAALGLLFVPAREHGNRYG